MRKRGSTSRSNKCNPFLSLVKEGTSTCQSIVHKKKTTKPLLLVKTVCWCALLSSFSRGEKRVACPQEWLTPQASLRKISNALIKSEESWASCMEDSRWLLCFTLQPAWWTFLLLQYYWLPWFLEQFNCQVTNSFVFVALSSFTHGEQKVCLAWPGTLPAKTLGYLSCWHKVTCFGDCQPQSL